MVSVLAFCVTDKNKTYAYEGERFTKNPWEKLVLMVSVVTKSLASRRITF